MGRWTGQFTDSCFSAAAVKGKTMINFQPDHMLSATARNESVCLQVLQKETSVSLKIDPRTNLSESILLLDGRMLSSLDFELEPGRHALSYELQDNRHTILESAEILLEAQPDSASFSLRDPEEQTVHSDEQPTQANLSFFEATESEKVFSADSCDSIHSAPVDSSVFSPMNPGEPSAAEALQVQVPFASSGSVTWNEPSFDLSVREAPEGSTLLIRQQDVQEIRPLQAGIQTVELTDSQTDVSLLDAGGSLMRSWTIRKEESEPLESGNEISPPDLTDESSQPDRPEPADRKPQLSISSDHRIPDSDHTQIAPVSSGFFSDRPGLLQPEEITEPIDPDWSADDPADLPISFLQPGQKAENSASEGLSENGSAAEPLIPENRVEPAVNTQSSIPAGQIAAVSGFEQPASQVVSSISASPAASQIHPQKELPYSFAVERSAGLTVSALSSALLPGLDSSDSRRTESVVQPSGSMTRIRQALLKSPNASVQAVLKTGTRQYRSGNQLYVRDPQQVEIQVQNGSLQKLSVRSRATEKTYPDLQEAMKAETNTAFEVEASLQPSGQKTVEKARWTVIPAGETVHQKISFSAGEIETFYTLDQNGKLTGYQQTRLSAPLLCRGFDPVDSQQIIPGETLRLYVDPVPGSWQISLNGKTEIRNPEQDELGQPYLPIRAGHGKTELKVLRDGRTLCSQTLTVRNPFASFPTVYAALGAAVGGLLEYRRRRFV